MQIVLQHNSKHHLKSVDFLPLPSSGLQLFHSVSEGYGSIRSVFLALLGSGARGLVPWRPWSLAVGVGVAGSSGSASGWALLYHCSFVVFKMALLWLVTSALLHNYRYRYRGPSICLFCIFNQLRPGNASVHSPTLTTVHLLHGGTCG